MSLVPFLAKEHAHDVEHWWRDNGDGTSTIVSYQNVAPILDRNKAMRNHNDGYSQTRELRRVAFIPHVLRQKILAEEGWDPYRPDIYPEKMARLLNDPDYAYLRTADGRVGCINGQLR